jgi:hypothetical protein
MEKLEQKIIELNEVIEKLKLRVSDEVIFVQACSFVRGELAGQNKFTNDSKPKTPFVPNAFKNNPYHEEPASLKQTNLIKKLNKGIVPAGISKKEAYKLIQELNK